MKHFARALLLAFGIMLAALPAARAADTSCTTTLTGTISGNVVVPPGRICILNAATARVAPSQPRQFAVSNALRVGG